jgi:prepilin-type N-terminal cleavage/methylation domain-containing protein
MAHGSIQVHRFPAPRRSARPRCRAFTLVEVVLAILVVGVGLVATMQALPVVLGVSRATSRTLTAQRLAGDLMAEIAMLPFEDPDGNPKFGPEDDEHAGTRADFDDIDDYDDWSASPPERKDGSEEPGCGAYSRSVLVQSVEPDDFTHVCGDSSDKPKLITVTVSRAGMRPVSLAAVRLENANRED